MSVSEEEGRQIRPSAQERPTLITRTFKPNRRRTIIGGAVKLLLERGKTYLLGTAITQSNIALVLMDRNIPVRIAGEVRGQRLRSIPRSHCFSRTSSLRTCLRMEASCIFYLTC